MELFHSCCKCDKFIFEYGRQWNFITLCFSCCQQIQCLAQMGIINISFCFYDKSGLVHLDARLNFEPLFEFQIVIRRSAYFCIQR